MRKSAAERNTSIRFLLLLPFVWAAADASAQQLASPNPEIEGNFGYALSGLGDVSGDGVPDFAVGAYNEDDTAVDAGRVYIYSGLDGTLLHTLTSANQQEQGYFGLTVGNAGDVDNDGTPDFIVGAFGEDGQIADAGRVYIYSGATRNVLHTLLSPNPDPVEDFGNQAISIGDLDGDGRPDVIVSAERAPVGGKASAGSAYVFSGADGSFIRTLVSPDPENFGLFASRVWSLGDFNGDGTPDIGISATGENGGATDAGRAYLFSGADGTLLSTLTSPDPTTGGFYGSGGSLRGDLTGDGIVDFAVGAVGEDVGEGAGSIGSAGHVYVYSGADASVVMTLTSPNPSPGGFFGNWALGGGDLNDDNVADIVVTAWREDGGAADAGRAYIFSGADGTLLSTLTSRNPAANGYYGHILASAGDLDGDGAFDFGIGAPGEQGGANGAGRAYFISGATGVVVPIETEPIEPSRDHELTVWPNPFRGQAQFVLTTRTAQPVTVTVTDVLGRQVAVLHEGMLAPNVPYPLTVEGYALPAGVYFLRAVGEDFAIVRQVVLLK